MYDNKCTRTPKRRGKPTPEQVALVHLNDRHPSVAVKEREDLLASPKFLAPVVKEVEERGTPRWLTLTLRWTMSAERGMQTRSWRQKQEKSMHITCARLQAELGSYVMC